VPPSTDQEPARTVELERLDDAVDRLVLRLRELLAGAESAELAAERLIETVCRRRAEIEGDPGWLDVYLQLSEVTTEIRRAGLDLDPGYLPWLGTVVRFHYV